MWPFKKKKYWGGEHLLVTYWEHDASQGRGGQATLHWTCACGMSGWEFVGADAPFHTFTGHRLIMKEFG